MATYVLQNSAQQIDQAVGAAYSGLIVAGTGIVRLTGAQEISGVKSFQDLSYFESGAVFSGSSSFQSVALSEAVTALSPETDNSVDLGSQSKRFKTGWFDTITGNSGVFGGDLTVLGTLNATIVPAISLSGAQGDNLTLSGTTNLVNANFSGNSIVAGTTTLSGNLNVSGDSLLNGTITATGNKSFSGTFFQSGNSLFSGNINHNGALISTGAWSHTGTLYQSGNVNSIGSLSHSGEASFNNSFTGFLISGGGAGQSVTIYSPLNIIGDTDISGASMIVKNALSHSGLFSQTGNVFITGDVRVSGNSTVVGTSTLSGNATITNGALNLSGNASSPSVVFNKSLTTAASGGALEYDRSFFVTTETTGAPNRALVNQTFSYLAPQNFYAAIPTANATTPLLENTGIYLNTGRYHIKYDVKFSLGNATARTLKLGITGNQANITNRIGSLSSAANPSTNINPEVIRTGFYGETATDNIFATAVNINNVLASDSWNSFYSFDAIVTITGLTKIRPIFALGAAVALTGRAFSMQVTQLSTGTGVGLVGANGPWSDA
jgi:formylmethanofuran dehydrogenase subunit C